jgi:hypothetical protein
MYKELKIKKVIKTIDKLNKRIDERIPGSSLSQVCFGLHRTAVEAQNRIADLLKPNKYIRISVVSVIIVFITLLIYTFSILEWQFSKPNITELIQITEALINDIILVSAALFFLITIEKRMKRRDILEELHQLRSIAHVIDMHQLTKDPSMLDTELKNTDNSPKRTMTEPEMQRYLEYCSEMLSLIGKIAALFSERLPEPAIVSAANEIETLCTGLSRKVWQKMVFVRKR